MPLQQHLKSWRIFSSCWYSVAAIATMATVAVCASIFTVFILIRLLMPAPSPYTEDPVVLEIEPLANGWQRFVTNELEIALPASYISRVPKEVLAEASEQDLDRKSQMRLKVAQMFSEQYSFIAFDTESKTSGYTTNIVINRIQALSALEPESFLEMAAEQLGEDIRERKVTRIAGQAGTANVTYAVTEGFEVLQLKVATKVTDTIWVVAFATGAEEFDSRRADFERSLDSFRLQPVARP